MGTQRTQQGCRGQALHEEFSSWPAGRQRESKAGGLDLQMIPSSAESVCGCYYMVSPAKLRHVCTLLAASLDLLTPLSSWARILSLSCLLPGRPQLRGKTAPFNSHHNTSAWTKRSHDTGESHDMTRVSHMTRWGSHNT